MIVMIAGEPFSGKTISAATFPKPMLFLDWDGGSSSIARSSNEEGQPLIKEQDKIKIIHLHKEEIIGLDFTTSRYKGSAPPHTRHAIPLVAKFNSIIKGIKEGEYQTLIIDPLSSMFRVWKESCLARNQIGKLSPEDWGTLYEVLFGQFLPTLKALPINYIVLVNHIDIEKDEISGQVLMHPVGPSKAQGRLIGAEIDAIFKQENKGGHYNWRTKKVGMFDAGGWLTVPDPLPANFESLKPFIKRKEAVKKRL